MNGIVSVIIPTYRRYEMLKEAIQSVLNQNYDKIQIIVIDDNSNDNTSKIADDFPQITFLQNEQNKGPGYSRKVGFFHSCGEYIVFLDDDDYYTDPEFFQTAVCLLQSNSALNFISANAKILYVDTGKIESSKLNVVGEWSAIDYLKGFPFQNRKPHSTFTTIFRRDVLVESGIEKMSMVNDVAIYMRALTVGKIFFLQQEIGVYRIHSNNISKNITSNFLIENLKERLHIYSEIKNKNLFEDVDEWWFKQINGIISYFVFGTYPNLFEFQKVRIWCIRNSVDKHRIVKLFDQYFLQLVNFKICMAKSFIKKVLNL